MKCRLCLQNRQICNSHIIPEFLYRPGYDDKGRMSLLKKGKFQPKYIQKGLREKLLCNECEGLIGNQYEDYFSKLWYLKKTLPSSSTDEFFEIPSLDYSLFKLFHLSILWRASISSLEPFSMVSLGEREEHIRQMLINGDAAQPTEYQIFGALLLSPETTNVLDGFIVSPTIEVYEGLPVYMFAFGGCIWHYVASNHPIEGLLPISLSITGNMKMPVRDLRVVKPITLFFES